MLCLILENMVRGMQKVIKKLTKINAKSMLEKVMYDAQMESKRNPYLRKAWTKSDAKMNVKKHVK